MKWHTGILRWRLNPPSVSLLCEEEEAISELKRAGLEEFLQVRYKINKIAILKNPEAISGLSCIAIKPRSEYMEIIPTGCEAVKLYLE